MLLFVSRLHSLLVLSRECAYILGLYVLLITLFQKDQHFSVMLLLLCRETNNLAECVMELKHAKKRLEDQNKDLQIQIHSSENSYATLQRDYKDMCDKLYR